jgi:hypothetical protein
MHQYVIYNISKICDRDIFRFPAILILTSKNVENRAKIQIIGAIGVIHKSFTVVNIHILLGCLKGPTVAISHLNVVVCILRLNISKAKIAIDLLGLI